MSDEGAADPGLIAYAEAIEADLTRRRGAEVALSPRDFALAKGWYQAGIPLAVVLVGIDRAFAAEPSASSLAFCRRRIEELFASGPGGTSPGAPPGGSAGLAEVAEVLGALRERLGELPRAGFALALRKTEEVLDLVAVASRPNWDYVRAKLREIDALVSQAALEALPAAAAEELRREVKRAAARHRGRVDPASLEDAAARLLRQRAREHLKLPRVSAL